MNSLGLMRLFVPVEALPAFAALCIAMAGFCLMFGLRKAAGVAFTTAITSLLLPVLMPVIKTFLLSLPVLVLVPLLLGVGLVCIGRFGGRFFGRVAAHVCGDLLSSMIRWLFTSRSGLTVVAILALTVFLLTRSK